MTSIDSTAGSPLGKRVTYEAQYNPALLYPIPRIDKRRELGFGELLPFVGVDIWNAYELSWLNARGKPVVAIGEFSFPAESPCIIESKSLKLYLNSFNQTRMESREKAEATLTADLSAAAGAAVTVRLTPVDQMPARPMGVPSGVCIDSLDIDMDTYAPTPGLLRTMPGNVVNDETLYSHLLKSNCLVTGQPDWGMVAIRYSGPTIDRESLLRYIVSFREHNEFHEQCVERIFHDVLQQCGSTQLAVWARYTRRGGLDINPVRATDAAWAASGNLAESRQ